MIRDLTEAILEVEKARERDDKFEELYEAEKIKVDLLQADIDMIDDFYIKQLEELGATNRLKSFKSLQ